MIDLSFDGAVATVSLNRPQARNAMPIAAWDALADALPRLAEARVVILKSGVPGIFSAGADVHEFETLRADVALRSRFRLAMRRAIDGIADLPMPVIAAVDGGCFGAAVALTLAADVRVAGKDAAFAITPARLGIGYPEADVARLAAQVGRGVASLLLFTGDRISADEAKRIGLVDLASAKADETAAAVAATIAANAPGSVRLLKRTLRGEATDPDFEAAYGGSEFLEGLTAFRERRRPAY